MHQVHPAENDYKSLASLKCPLCESIFNATSKLHEHIQIDHNVHLEVVSKVLESVDGKYFHFFYCNDVIIHVYNIK